MIPVRSPDRPELHHALMPTITAARPSGLFQSFQQKDLPAAGEVMLAIILIPLFLTPPGGAV